MIDYTAGDRSPYTYVIRFPATNLFYYGVRYAKGCTPNDLGKTYFSSSKSVLSRLKLNQKAIFEVRQIFSSVEKAKQAETRFLQRVDARNNPKLLNRHNNDGLYPVDNRGSKNPAYGKPGTMLGKKFSSESLLKLSIAKRGSLNGFFGKHHTEETAARIGDLQRGSKHKKFKGLYHTPYGIFETSREAMVQGLSHGTIRRWCNNSDHTITANTLRQTSYLNVSSLGKTFREIGFWFEPI